jgi:hypothetical protein
VEEQLCSHGEIHPSNDRRANIAELGFCRKEGSMRFEEVKLGIAIACSALMIVAQGETRAQAPAQGVTAAGPAQTPRSAGQPAVPTPSMVQDDEHGFLPIFDGKTLDGWDGAPGFWKVEDGMIVGRSTKAHPSGVNFLIWRGGTPGDFELKLDIRFEGQGNSGIQYHSWTQPYPSFPAPAAGQAMPAPPGGGSLKDMFNPAYEKWNMAGLQFDVDVNTIGGFYEGGGGTARGYLARPGNIIRLETGQQPRRIGTFDAASIIAANPSDWHSLHLIAHGNVFIQEVDGMPSTIAIDDDPTHRKADGLIGIQLESTGDATVSVRNIRLKTEDH